MDLSTFFFQFYIKLQIALESMLKQSSGNYKMYTYLVSVQPREEKKIVALQYS